MIERRDGWLTLGVVVVATLVGCDTFARPAPSAEDVTSPAQFPTPNAGRPFFTAGTTGTVFPLPSVAGVGAIAGAGFGAIAGTGGRAAGSGAAGAGRGAPPQAESDAGLDDAGPQ